MSSEPIMAGSTRVSEVAMAGVWRGEGGREVGCERPRVHMVQKRPLASNRSVSNVVRLGWWRTTGESADSGCWRPRSERSGMAERARRRHDKAASADGQAGTPMERGSPWTRATTVRGEVARSEVRPATKRQLGEVALVLLLTDVTRWSSRAKYVAAIRQGAVRYKKRSPPQWSPTQRPQDGPVWLGLFSVFPSI